MEATEMTLKLERRFEAGSLGQNICHILDDVEKAMAINRMRAPGKVVRVHHPTSTMASVLGIGYSIVDSTNSEQSDFLRKEFARRLEDYREAMVSSLEAWPQEWKDGCMGWTIRIEETDSYLEYILTDEAWKAVGEAKRKAQEDYDRECAAYYASKGSGGYCGD